MQKFTGIEYLKIDMASTFGLDKKDWDERIEWTNSHMDEIIDMLGVTADGKKSHALLEEADEPAMFFASCIAFQKAIARQPSGYGINLDATASGLQFLSLLTNCETSARLCNLVSTGHREDAYTTIYQAMCKETGMQEKISRADTKQAIMTSLYTSTAEPKKVFGGGELLRVFYEKMQSMVPGAWELNLALQSLWQPYALSHDWVLPDNFHAHVKVMDKAMESFWWMDEQFYVHLNLNQGAKEGRSISPNIIHSIDGMVVREMLRRCNFRKEDIIRIASALNSRNKSISRESDKMVIKLWEHFLYSGFLSARILQYLDEENMGHVDPMQIALLIKSMPKEPFYLVAIHDCFRVLPNYANDLRRQYNRVLSQIAKSDLLSFIASQITGHSMPINKLGDIHKQILQADYALS